MLSSILAGGQPPQHADDVGLREDGMKTVTALLMLVRHWNYPKVKLPLSLDNPHGRANKGHSCLGSLYVGMSNTSNIKRLKIFFHKVVLMIKFDNGCETFSTVSGLYTVFYLFLYSVC